MNDLEKITQSWREESVAANKAIIEILESFMTTVDLMNKALEALSHLEDPQSRSVIISTTKIALGYAQETWKPLLKDAKSLLAKENQDEE